MCQQHQLARTVMDNVRSSTPGFKWERRGPSAGPLILAALVVAAVVLIPVLVAAKSGGAP